MPHPAYMTSINRNPYHCNSTS